VRQIYLRDTSRQAELQGIKYGQRGTNSLEIVFQEKVKCSMICYKTEPQPPAKEGVGTYIIIESAYKPNSQAKLKQQRGKTRQDRTA
jgi:hypothetical protein